VGKIITNGPFRLEACQRGESIVLMRNPAYHGRFRGNLQRVELSLIEKWLARLELYEADGLDVIYVWGLPPMEKDRARQRHAGEYVTVPWLSTQSVGFDMSRPPFDDVRVRRAFVLATDRETMINVTMSGHFFPATGGFIPPGMPGHSPGIGLPYDPHQARQLLADAGYPGGRGFPVVALRVWRTPTFQEMGEHLRAYWRENLGVEIAGETVEFGAFADSLEREPPHMSILPWVADYPDPDNLLRVGFPWKATGWRNEAYNRPIEKARRITDQRERMRLYGQADRILVEEASIMPLFYARFDLLVKPWVKKFPMSPMKVWFWKDVIIEPH
jgi:oligopeptide transport system substrate-binding protein